MALVTQTLETIKEAAGEKSGTSAPEFRVRPDWSERTLTAPYSRRLFSLFCGNLPCISLFSGNLIFLISTCFLKKSRGSAFFPVKNLANPKKSVYFAPS
jgi:hypothetical protein